jgi:thiamine-monophosphate kinase
MIDVSDGLLADLGHVAAASSVAIRLHPDALPVDEPIEAMARGLGVDPRSWVLGGGEDHALAACFDPAVTLPDTWTIIGTVAEGSGVRVEGWDALPDGLDPSGGYQHFSR